MSLGSVESEHLLHIAFEPVSPLREHPPQLATPVAPSSQHARHFAELFSVMDITFDVSVEAQDVQIPPDASEQIDAPIGELTL